jgi:hypothetical protein
MASEDSVEYFIDRPSTPLALMVHRISDLHDGRQPSGPTVQADLEKMHGIFKKVDVVTSRRKAHVLPHERQHMPGNVLPRVDREHEHVRVAWLWPDPAALEHLLSKLQELSTSPVLIHEKLRLNVVAEGTRWTSLHRDAPTALSLHNAGHKPALRLQARQSFLLIVRTHRIFTMPPTWDGIRSVGYSDVPAYS